MARQILDLRTNGCSVRPHEASIRPNIGCARDEFSLSENPVSGEMRVSKRVMAGVAVGIAAVLGGGVYALAQYQANQAMEAIRIQVTTHIEGSTLTNGEVKANIFEGSMTVRDLVFQKPEAKGTVKVAEMLLDGNEDQLVAAVFKDIDLLDAENPDFGGIDRIIVSNLKLKRLQLPAEASREAVLAFLENLTVGRLLVENVAFGKENGKVSAGNLRVSGVKKGVADKISISAALTDFSTSEEVKKASIKSLTLSQVDMKSFARWDTNNTEQTAEETFAEIVDSATHGPIEFDNLSFEVDDVKISVGGLRTSGMDGGLIEKFAMKEMNFATLQNEKEEGFSVKNLAFEGLNLAAFGAAEKRKAGSAAELTLPEFWRRVKVGHIAIEDLKGEANAALFSVVKYEMSNVEGGIAGNLTITDATVSGIENKEIQSVGFKKIKVDSLDLLIARKSQEEMLRGAQNFFGIDAMLFGGFQVKLKNGAAVSVEKFELDEIQRHSGFLTGGRFILDNVEFPVSAVSKWNPEAGAFLQGFSNDVFNASMNSDSKYDAPSGGIVQSMGMSVKGMGKFKIDVELTGFDVETYKNLSQGKYTNLDWLERGDLKLVSFSIHYLDEKLADWLIDNYSNGNRVGLGEHLAANVSGFSADRMFIQLASEEIKRFIVGANRFLITAKPSSPVTIGAVRQAMERGAISNILNLQLSGQ